MLNVATAARLRFGRDVRMMRPDLVATEARRVGHVMPRPNDGQPSRAGNHRLMARVALLPEHRVRRRNRSRGERSCAPRCGKPKPHHCRHNRNERKPPLPQPYRRAFLEIVEVMPPGDRLRCTFADCQAGPPFNQSISDNQQLRTVPKTSAQRQREYKPAATAPRTQADEPAANYAASDAVEPDDRVGASLRRHLRARG